MNGPLRGELAATAAGKNWRQPAAWRRGSDGGRRRHLQAALGPAFCRRLSAARLGVFGQFSCATLRMALLPVGRRTCVREGAHLLPPHALPRLSPACTPSRRRQADEGGWAWQLLTGLAALSPGLSCVRTGLGPQSWRPRWWRFCIALLLRISAWRAAAYPPPCGDASLRGDAAGSAGRLRTAFALGCGKPQHRRAAGGGRIWPPGGLPRRMKARHPLLLSGFFEDLGDAWAGGWCMSGGFASLPGGASRMAAGAALPSEGGAVFRRPDAARLGSISAGGDGGTRRFGAPLARTIAGWPSLYSSVCVRPRYYSGPLMSVS